MEEKSHQLFDYGSRFCSVSVTFRLVLYSDYGNSLPVLVNDFGLLDLASWTIL